MYANTKNRKTKTGENVERTRKKEKEFEPLTIYDTSWCIKYNIYGWRIFLTCPSVHTPLCCIYSHQNAQLFLCECERCGMEIVSADMCKLHEYSLIRRKPEFGRFYANKRRNKTNAFFLRTSSFHRAEPQNKKSVKLNDEPFTLRIQ